MLRVPVMVAMLAACGGCRLSYEIPRAEAREWMQAYYDATLPYAEIDGDHARIGHQAGNASRYPQNLNGTETEPAEPTAINELIDDGFGELGLTAVEVDLRPSPLPGDDRLVVVHDEIKAKGLSDVALAYMRDNTLQAMLQHFADRGYHQQGYSLLLELKVPHHRDGTLDDGSDELIRSVAAAIRGFDDHPQRESLMSSIGFLTFTFAGLEKLRETIGPDAGCRYYLLSTSNQFPWWIFEWFTKIPRFDDDVEATLVDTPWLTGTVFAPRWINHFREIFNDINTRRIDAGLPPLELHLAIYSESFEDYAALIARATNKGADPLEHVKGFVFEIGP